MRGVVPKDADSLTENSICWPQVAKGSLPPVKGLIFGDPNGLSKEEQDINGDLLRAYAKANATQLGFPHGHDPIEAPSFHPIFRIGPYGNLIIDMVVELVETRIETRHEEIGPYPFRSGVTLLIWQEFLDKGTRAAPQIHYIIPKHCSEEREKRQRLHFTALPRTGRHDENSHLPNGKDEIDRKQVEAAWKIDFGLVHTRL